MEHTSGEFIVICDADTRVFPTFLEHTLGYFRDPDVAWVQTPQWFYDIPEGVPLSDRPGGSLYGRLGRTAGTRVERCSARCGSGEDPFWNDAPFSTT